MNLYFKNADGLIDGINLVAEDLCISEVSENEADISVVITKAKDKMLSVMLNGKKASIIYGGGKARFFRALAILVKWIKDGETDKYIKETPLFDTNGAMVDVSRNGVMNLKTVKFMMRKMALMGLNTYMLYTEDTYEVENRPYFGYMKGRYTKEEIQELDKYAITLGIELVPCVQFLGHLATMLRWRAAAPYKDTANVLLVGAEETYKLIDDMLRSISASFSSKRLHMGMDETHDLGLGKYLDINGYRERQDIFFEHLNKVAEMAKSYGFQPMMWSDMFFRMAGKDIPGFGDYDKRTVLPADIGKYVPAGVQQIFWDYYHPDQEFYDVNIEKHKLLGDNTLFAGGVWTWSGHCPQYSRSLRNSLPALDSCKKYGIKEVIATVWHNGSECNLIMSLAGLTWYADYDYKGRYDEDSVKECFNYSCGQSYDEFMKTELPEYPHGDNTHTGITRALLYNDPLTGLMDKQISAMDTASYYKNVSEQIKDIGCNAGTFSPAIEVIKKLSSVLENKADFGVRLKNAYDTKDNQALSALAAECDIISDKIKALREIHRTAWMEYNKPFGWDIHDIRYGGLIMRFDTAKIRINAYLAGELDRMEDLEEERLRFDCREDGSPFGGDFLWYHYPTLTTASRW